MGTKGGKAKFMCVGQVKEGKGGSLWGKGLSGLQYRWVTGKNNGVTQGKGEARGRG